MIRRLLMALLVALLATGCGAPVRKPAPPPATPPPVVKPAPPPVLTPPPPVLTPPPVVVTPPPVVKPTPPVVPVPSAPEVKPPGTLKPPTASVPPKAIAPLVRLPADRIPVFADDMDLVSLEIAIEKSLQYLNRAAGSGPYRVDDTVVTVQEIKDSLISLREILRRNESQEARQTLIRETFDVYQSTGLDGKNTVKFTGYFEPIMNGSLKRTDQFRYPLYRTPKDAVVVNLGKYGDRFPNEQLVGRIKNGELIPYYTRSEIEDLGALAGRNLELAWVDDRIALFFLHIQGSGKLRLPSGKLYQVGYALKNGRPFQSLGSFLVDTGKITPQQLSYQSIKRYLREHPEAVPELLGHNESYVFFREVGEGPVGALGEILTPGRSIATDPSVFPRGALAFMRARKPILDKEGNAEGWIPFTRFVVSQDVGGAIKGAGRVDLFCGSGDEAEMLAGSLAEQGELFFLLKKRPKGAAPEVAARP
jgi:membrane-bound lytic murein transglycosylase A